MAWEFHVLVVANVTATSDELLTALKEREKQGACRFTLVMPRSGTGAAERLEEALEAMRGAGLGKVDGRVGDPDPVVASTLPTGVSRWLGLDLPHRLEKLTGVTVHHVVAQPQAEVNWERPPEREDYGVLSPLAAALTRRP
jgi:hypothetical protein